MRNEEKEEPSKAERKIREENRVNSRSQEPNLNGGFFSSIKKGKITLQLPW